MLRPRDARPLDLSLRLQPQSHIVLYLLARGFPDRGVAVARSHPPPWLKGHQPSRQDYRSSRRTRLDLSLPSVAPCRKLSMSLVKVCVWTYGSVFVCTSSGSVRMRMASTSPNSFVVRSVDRHTCKDAILCADTTAAYHMNVSVCVLATTASSAIAGDRCRAGAAARGSGTFGLQSSHSAIAGGACPRSCLEYGSSTTGGDGPNSNQLRLILCDECTSTAFFCSSTGCMLL